MYTKPISLDVLAGMDLREDDPSCCAGGEPVSTSIKTPEASTSVVDSISSIKTFQPGDQCAAIAQGTWQMTSEPLGPIAKCARMMPNDHVSVSYKEYFDLDKETVIGVRQAWSTKEPVNEGDETLSSSR